MTVKLKNRRVKILLRRSANLGGDNWQTVELGQEADISDSADGGQAYTQMILETRDVLKKAFSGKLNGSPDSNGE